MTETNTLAVIDGTLTTIYRFINTPGKSGPEIANFLKSLTGSEQEGLQHVARTYFKVGFGQGFGRGFVRGYAQGLRTGEIRGLVKGSAGTLILLGGAKLLKNLGQSHDAPKGLSVEDSKNLQAICDCEQGTDTAPAKNGCVEQGQKFRIYSAETGDLLADINS